ncbi:TIGR01777 family oxidoreductase [Oceanihabitans sediminis]|uniref:TIGR01777 family oxidoreductase n=1 Tax=Oceanihabitans sediminis TaxID=1812012 RepID=UPI0009305264|nr:TIGR01777 family oxidoreductase [Oceanihabitans sediminis]MDX1278773.1 TIGR01777 family oxidoreductase [Oceanihabitans sediminis]MDX1773819.1 TIGR01777 family oxidoreductase [Oceanihabitans sediminis]
MKTILIAGGTGFIGQTLEKYFTNKGHQVKILSRHPSRENEIYWNAKDLEDSWVSHLENLDVLINLTGKNINCKFTEKNKELITKSRIDSTKILGKAIDTCQNPPKLWMNSSTTSLYKDSFDTEMSEENHEIGNDFEKEVAEVWEEAFYASENPKTRKIIIRTSLVFGKGDGAFVPLKKLTQFGLGGKQGSGKQKVSWIHQTDFARAIEFLMNKEDASGPFNFCVPNPISNNYMMEAFRKAIGIPFGLPSPEFILKIGAYFIQTEPELILKSRNVIPKKLLDSGFEFQYSTIEAALKDLID